MTSQHALTELNQKFTQWSSRIEQNKQELEEELNRWKGYKEDYDALGKQLETLADETTRPAMIPFGSLAFMPGKLIHTNEITVYLGDQYYVERSTKQALGILNRRKEGVNENLGLVQAQWNALEAKSTTTSNNKNLFPSAEGVNEEGLPIMEIREEIPDDPADDITTTKDIATASSSSAIAPSSPPPPAATTTTEAPPPKPSSPTTTEPSNDLMAMLDALEQEEEEEEREKRQQMMEQQLTFDMEDEEQKDMDYDDEDIDDLYDTEVADTMFDHFEDDEEYATQGVVEQEDATTHEHEEEEEEEEPIKDTVAERPEQVAQSTPPPPPQVPEPEPAVVSTATEHKEPPKEKKLSKFKQLQLEKQQQEAATTAEDQPKKSTTANKMPKFKVQKPTERKRKQQQQQSPPLIASSSTTATSSDKTSTMVPPVISSQPIENQSSSSSSSSPPKKKISKFKQFQEQQRQGLTGSTDVRTTTTIKSTPTQSKGTPITVPNKYTSITPPTTNKKATPESSTSTSTSSGKKKVSFGATTSVREHDHLASPQADPQGVYSQPLKEEASSTNTTFQHTIRSPSDIFRVVKQHQPKLEQDGYPTLEDDDGNNNDTVDLRDLATTIQDAEAMFRPNYDVDEDQLPTMHPWRQPMGGGSSLVQSKSKMDTNTMRGAVLEREAEELDLDQVEDDMDFKEIKSSYQRQRQNMLATMGGLSFDPKPEFEVYDEDLPLPSNDKKKSANKNDDDDDQAAAVVDVPKKMSRFKAARMGLTPATEQ